MQREEAGVAPQPNAETPQPGPSSGAVATRNLQTQFGASSSRSMEPQPGPSRSKT